MPLEAFVMPETELEQKSDGSMPDADAPDVLIVEDTASSELAPETEGSQKDKEPTPEERTKKLEDSLAEANFHRRSERREREAAQAQLQRLQHEQSANQGERPNIPDLPDQFDDDFAEKLSKREGAIREAERFDANAGLQVQYQNQQAQQAQHHQQQAIQKSADTFRERATKLGVTETELKHNGERVISSQALTDAEVEMILTDEHGPLITKYLSENLGELERLAAMPPGSSQRMVTLITDIKQKASALQAKTTDTPAPLDGINGNAGAASEKYPGTEGMTFM